MLNTKKFQNTNRVIKGLSSLIFLAGFLLILYYWFQGLYKPYQELSAMLRNISTLAALLAVYSVLWQVIMIGRNPLLERAFGFDRLTRYHHLAGFVSLILMIIHFVFVIIGPAIKYHSPYWRQFINTLQLEDINKALIALIIFIIIVVASLSIVIKKLPYEYWYGVHIFTYLAIALAFGHQLEQGHDFYQSNFAIFWILFYLIAFGMLGIFRFLRPLYYFYKFNFKVERVVPEGGEAFSIYISGKNLGQFPIQAGQFMILRFLQRGFWYEAHPFSLSCLPNANYLRITYKKLGNFTNKMEKLAVGTSVIIDGPNGAFVSRKAKNKNIVLVAGGVGITPLRALAEDFLQNDYKVNLIYSSRNYQNLILGKEIEELKKVYPNFSYCFVLTDDANWTGEKKILEGSDICRLSSDIKNSDVYICGPKPMMKVLEKGLIKEGVKRQNIHMEKFSLG